MQGDKVTQYVKGLEAIALFQVQTKMINESLNFINPSKSDLEEISKLEKYVGKIDAVRFYYYHDARVSDLDEYVIDTLAEEYGFSKEKSKMYFESHIFETGESAISFLEDVESGEDFYDSIRKHVWGFTKPTKKDTFYEKVIPSKEIDLFLETLGFGTVEEVIEYADFRRHY